ncbi:prepilin peptidase [Yoonia sediminilitoris]|uniref:Flp pilus assembly protein protease CpaA n=1 Tax=Yoonia sediminilitoris TaxID=1286148 RepID=A0A2T6KS07_9RHOB|nr:prepilin peptidase [Yoonia sediminilitoris]PUB19344.1 Flp pilus assembly protein protease CpaA [Yoonia sediminilitoris]RCW99512.1 Flp pilus assembly protein protease CpaA [Yoonia sediminilitoris]
MIAQYAPLGVVALLLAATLIELKTGKIPNWLTLLPFVLFILVVGAAADKGAYVWQMGLAAAVFVVGLLLFAFAGFGAGAVKLMTGLALFIPLQSGVTALGVFIASLFVVTFTLVQMRKFGVGAGSNWHVFTASKSLPLSMPLAITGAAALLFL